MAGTNCTSVFASSSRRCRTRSWPPARSRNWRRSCIAANGISAGCFAPSLACRCASVRPNYAYNGRGNYWSDNTAFHIAVTQTSVGSGTWAITRTGGVSDYDTGTYTGDVANFKLYVGQTDAGSANDFFANSIAVTMVPEPGTAALLGLGALAMLWRRRG